MKRFYHINLIGYENLYFEHYTKELEQIEKESGVNAELIPLVVTIKLCQTKYGDKYLVKNFYKPNNDYYFFNERTWETMSNRANVSNDIVKRETVKTWQFNIEDFEMLENALTKHCYK